MPPGPERKDIKHGRTPNSPAGDWLDVEDKPYEAAPPFPAKNGRAKWHDLTLSWWQHVSTMPHCVLWRAEDWQLALELAYMKDNFFKAGEDAKTSAATEIRRREDLLGIGLAARQRLRIRYVKAVQQVAASTPAEQGPAGSPDGKVLSLADRRAAITQSA